jgi:ketosteroid isomerase-like protein
MTAADAEKNDKLSAITAFFEAYAAGDRDGIGAVLAPAVEWTIPGHHPLSGTKHGVDEVLAFFDALAAAGFKAETFFLEASDEYVVDIHRGYSTAGVGGVDTTWALVWHFDAAGRIDRVINLSGDQHQMDAFIWANYQLKPLPERLATEQSDVVGVASVGA